MNILKNKHDKLFEAAKRGLPDDVKRYLQEEADVNAKDKDGRTALYVAAEKGHKNVAELLIAKGADVNAKDKDGCTPLRYAVLRGRRHMDMVDLLIKHGAVE